MSPTAASPRRTRCRRGPNAIAALARKRTTTRQDPGRGRGFEAMWTTSVPVVRHATEVLAGCGALAVGDMEEGRGPTLLDGYGRADAAVHAAADQNNSEVIAHEGSVTSSGGDCQRKSVKGTQNGRSKDGPTVRKRKGHNRRL
mgnify:CR=1 FL=1